MIKKNLSKTFVMATLMAISGMSVQATKQEVQIQEGSFKKFMHAISCGCFRTHDNAFVVKQGVVASPKEVVAPVVTAPVVNPVVTEVEKVQEKKQAPSKEVLEVLRKARPAKVKSQEEAKVTIQEKIVKELDARDFSTWTLEYQEFYVAHEKEILPVMTKSAGWDNYFYSNKASILQKKQAVAKWVNLVKKAK
ncbi:MAG: hypothetical protein ABH827_01515 [bacterium]